MNYFRDNYSNLNLFRVLLVIFAIIAVTSPIITIMLLQEEKKVIIMDSAGNFHLAVGMDFRDAQKLHLRCVQAAVAALLTRSPEDYIYKDLLYQAFLRNCDDYLRKHMDDTREEFKLKRIRQIPEIKRVKILDQGNGQYLAHVLVYLTRACQYQEAKFVENLDCTLSFLMVENPDISANGRLPLAVIKVIRFDLKKAEKK